MAKMSKEDSKELKSMGKKGFIKNEKADIKAAGGLKPAKGGFPKGKKK